MTEQASPIFRLLPLAALAAVALSVPTFAQHSGLEVNVIYTAFPGFPTSELPGSPGLILDDLDSPFVSANGQHWAISVNLDTGSADDDERLIVDGVEVIVEGSSPAYAPAGRVLQRIDTKMGLTNTGAFAALVNIDGDTADDDLVVVGDGSGVITVEAQEGNPIPGAPAGWIHGPIDGVGFTDAGPSYMTNPVTGGPLPGQQDVAMFGGAVLLQSGVDIPAGQVAGGTNPWVSFEFGDFWSSPDGSNYLIEGETNSPLGVIEVAAKNGNVVLQEGQVVQITVAGQVVPRTIDDVRLSYMTDTGDYILAGRFTNGVGYVFYNGELVSFAGEPIVPDTTEVFNAIVSVAVCNSVGDFVLGGETNLASAEDDVLVLNEERIICRQGDPIDLDGNGLFDDDVFFGNFSSGNQAVLTDDLLLYITAILEDGAGDQLGRAFLVMDLEPDDTGVTAYGCDVNPPGSLTLLSGTPNIGETFTLGVDNPIATQPVGSIAALAFSGAPDPNFPCGTVLPGLGMVGPYGPGELLISLGAPGSLVILPPQIWNGSPAGFPISIPSNPALAGLFLYFQGAIAEVTGQFALTEGVQVEIGG